MDIDENELIQSEDALSGTSVLPGKPAPTGEATRREQKNKNKKRKYASVVRRWLPTSPPPVPKQDGSHNATKAERLAAYQAYQAEVERLKRSASYSPDSGLRWAGDHVPDWEKELEVFAQDFSQNPEDMVLAIQTDKIFWRKNHRFERLARYVHNFERALHEMSWVLVARYKLANKRQDDLFIPEPTPEEVDQLVADYASEARTPALLDLWNRAKDGLAETHAPNKALAKKAAKACAKPVPPRFREWSQKMAGKYPAT
jgi:hypothetical protein